MNVINSVVLSANSLASFLPMAAIVICVGAVLMLLLKIVQGEEVMRHNTMANINATVQVPRLKMTRVYIPFTFRLLETGNNSYDEIRLAVSSQIKYSLQAFWAVSIRELHMSLWRPWSELSDVAKLPESTIVDPAHCQHLAIDLRNQQPHVENIITLRSPKPPLHLGAPPRLAYPLVVFLIKETEKDEISHPDETVVLINVVHLRDPVCPLPTSVLAQYLKQASGQLSCLKQLYLATGDTLSSDETTTNPQNGSLSLAEPVACAGSSGPLLCSDSILKDGQQQSEQLCVVCHYFPLSRALLPCRHTCICAVCFSKLDRCPMCRAPINSYFCIRSEEYVPANTTETKSPKSKGPGTNWIDALNDRLTDFLGFR